MRSSGEAWVAKIRWILELLYAGGEPMDVEGGNAIGNVKIAAVRPGLCDSHRTERLAHPAEREGGTIGPMRQKLVLAAGCLVCMVVCWKNFLAFEGTEFGSGLLAGNKDIGGLLFFVALVLTFKFPVSGAITALVACFCSLPLYLYLVFPRPFRLVWPGQWKALTLPRENFAWDGWWITGIFVIVLVAYASCRSLVLRLLARKSGAVGH